MNKFLSITGTILVSFILTVSTFPLGSFAPDWTQLFLIYWIIAIPMSIGLFSSWIIGILVDVIMGSTLGMCFNVYNGHLFDLYDSSYS